MNTFKPISALILCVFLSGCATMRYQPTRAVQSQAQIDADLYKGIGLTLLIASGVGALIYLIYKVDNLERKPAGVEYNPKLVSDENPTGITGYPIVPEPAENTDIIEYEAGRGAEGVLGYEPKPNPSRSPKK